MSLKQSILKRCRAECSEEVQSLLLAIKERQEVVDGYEKRGLLPGDAARILHHLYEQPPPDNTPAALETHASTIAKVRAIAENPTIQFEAKRSVDAAFLKLQEPVLKLEEAAAASLGKQLAELVEAERAFQEQYGLPHYETPVSRTAAEMLASIRTHCFSASAEKVTGNPVLNPVSRLDLGGLQILLQT